MEEFKEHIERIKQHQALYDAGSPQHNLLGNMLKAEIEAHHHQTIQTIEDFLTFCQKVDPIWAKEFREWIPEYIETLHKNQQS